MQSSSSVPSSSTLLSPGIRRSFARTKQVKELLNTEQVYVESLKVLRNTYIGRLCNDPLTPNYFKTFYRVIDQLWMKHGVFLAQVRDIYTRWDNVQAEHLDSPEFTDYHIPLNEQQCLVDLLELISHDAVDVGLYSVYCGLCAKVQRFAAGKNVERFRRQMLTIVDDYKVERQYPGSEESTFVSGSIDDRFISIVQMPTTRLVRYKLIVESLLKGTAGGNPEFLRIGHQTIDILERKVGLVNSFVRREDAENEKIERFRHLVRDQDPLFIDNLGNLQFCGSLCAVWLDGDEVVSEYCGSLLFENYLLLLSDRHVLFGIPTANILNNFESGSELDFSVGSLTTSYPFTLAVTTRMLNKFYNVILLLPSMYEQSQWRSRLKANAAVRSDDNLGRDQFVHPSIDHTSGRNTSHRFAVDHFIPSLNGVSSDKPAATALYHRLTKKKEAEILVERHQRVDAERLLNGLWSLELAQYHLDKSQAPALSRSLSNWSLRGRSSLRNLRASASMRSLAGTRGGGTTESPISSGTDNSVASDSTGSAVPRRTTHLLQRLFKGR